MNFNEAQAIDKCLKEIAEQANEVLYIANNSTDGNLKNAVKQCLGNAIVSIDMEIWELIYTQYPPLRPSEMIDFKNSDSGAS